MSWINNNSICKVPSLGHFIIASKPDQSGNPWQGSSGHNHRLFHSCPNFLNVDPETELCIELWLDSLVTQLSCLFYSKPYHMASYLSSGSCDTLCQHWGDSLLVTDPRIPLPARTPTPYFLTKLKVANSFCIDR